MTDYRYASDDVDAALAASSPQGKATILRDESGAMGGARVDVGMGHKNLSFVVERSSFLSIGIAPTGAPRLRVPLIFVLADESFRDPERALRTVDETVRTIAAEMPALDGRFLTRNYAQEMLHIRPRRSELHSVIGALFTAVCESFG